MPHIRIRALSAENVQQLSALLPEELAPIMNTSTDNFTFECIPTQFFKEGKPAAGYPFVEVLWFARDQKIQDACAQVITRKIQTLTTASDIAVIFVVLPQNSYYENGEHF
jgi:hypothetical protein